MALGLIASEANAIIDGLDGTLLQLHIGDPGAAGTTAPATETTRQGVTLNAAAAGTADNSVALTWTGIAGSQTPTHFSLWSLASGGTFRFSGTLSTAGYTAGNTFQIPIGDLDLTVTTVAA